MKYKYLMFNNVNHEYGADFDVTQLGSRKRGFGKYQEKDAKLLIKLHGVLVDEISEEQFEDLKKKLSRVPVTYRLFGTQQQEADKNPNAVYAETKSKQAEESKPAKDLIKVGVAKVEDPLEGKD